MTNIVFLPSDLNLKGTIRLTEELKARLESGEDLGSRKLQITQIDAMLGRAFADLQNHINSLDENDQIVEKLKASIDILIEQINFIRALARSIL